MTDVITNTASVPVYLTDSAGNPYTASGGGGGGGGAVTIADGADVALGATTNAVATSDTGTFSLIALTKRLLTKLSGTLTVQSTASAPTAGTDLSNTVTNTSGGFFLPQDLTRRPGDVQGQNPSATATIAFNEFNGTAAIGTTYTVGPLQPFSITTTNRVNFVSSAASSPVVITRL